MQFKIKRLIKPVALLTLLPIIFILLWKYTHLGAGSFGNRLLQNGITSILDALTRLSIYHLQRYFWHDWLIGGLIIGWLIPSSLYLLLSIWEYKSITVEPEGKKTASPVNLAPVKSHISKAYWRSRFLELEKISFSILAVGATLFAILLVCREYLTLWPFIDGATLLCFIGYSYVLNTHYFFTKFQSFREVISLIDQQMKLKEGLLTLWDNQQVEDPSPLFLLLAQRVLEKLKRFRLDLVFPHKIPKPSLYNFFFPLIIVSGMSFSSALALPHLCDTLKKYLKTVKEAPRYNNDADKKLPLNKLLSEQGEDLQKLGKEMANSPLAEKMAPSLQKLGDELINLSEKKNAVSVVSNKEADAQEAVKITNKKEEEKPNIFKALVANELAKLTPKEEEKPPTKEEKKAAAERKAALPPISNKSQVPFATMAPQTDKLKGDISKQLQQIAMDMLNKANEQKAQAMAKNQAGGNADNKSAPGQGNAATGTGSAANGDGDSKNGSGNAANKGSGDKKLGGLQGDKNEKVKDALNQYKSAAGTTPSPNGQNQPNSAAKGGQNPAGNPASNKEQKSEGMLTNLFKSLFGDDKSSKQPNPGENKNNAANKQNQQPGANNPAANQMANNKQDGNPAKNLNTPNGANKLENQLENKNNTANKQNQPGTKNQAENQLTNNKQDGNSVKSPNSTNKPENQAENKNNAQLGLNNKELNDKPNDAFEKDKKGQNQPNSAAKGRQNPAWNPGNKEQKNDGLLTSLYKGVFGDDKNNKQPNPGENKNNAANKPENQAENKNHAQLDNSGNKEQKNDGLLTSLYKGIFGDDKNSKPINPGDKQKNDNYDEQKTKDGKNPDITRRDDKLNNKVDNTQLEQKNKQLAADDKKQANNLLPNPEKGLSRQEQAPQENTTASPALLKEVKSTTQKLDNVSDALKKLAESDPKDLGLLNDKTLAKEQKGNPTAPKKPGDKNGTNNPPPDLSQMGEQVIAQRRNPQNIEVAPTTQLTALPDEFYEWYIKKWQEESKTPQPPPNAPLKDDIQEKVKVSAQKLEMLAGKMMMVSNPANVKFSDKAKDQMKGLMNKNNTLNAAPGGKTAPGLSNTPDPSADYQKMTASVTKELQSVLNETQEWVKTAEKEKDKGTADGKGDVFNGGTGSGKQDAVAVNGQSPTSGDRDTASLRLQSSSTHQPNHESLTNVSMETGPMAGQNKFQSDSQKRLSMMRQANTTNGNSSMDKTNVGGTPSARDFVGQQRLGLQQIKTAMDRATTPSDMSQITKQLSSLSKGLENVSLQLAQAMDSEAKSANKTIPAGQNVSKAGPGDNPGQNLKDIPHASNKVAEGISNKTQTNSKIPEQLNNLKQIKKDGFLPKGEQFLQADQASSNLSTGSNNFKEIAAQFAKLRTTLTGTTQSNQVKEITKQMLDLSKKLEQSGLDGVMMAGTDIKPEKKAGGNLLANSTENLQASTDSLSGKMIYPELGQMKGGDSKSLLNKREAVALPKELKEGLTKLQDMNNRLQKTKDPQEAQKLAKEILNVSQDLYKLTPKRSNQTVAIVKEGVKRQGEKIQDVSNKMNKEQNPQKLDGYSMELSLYAAKLKTLGDKADAMGWQEGKGVKKYASQVERSSEMLKKTLKDNKDLTQNKDIKDQLQEKENKELAQDKDEQQKQEMLMRRDAHRLEELSQTIATSNDPEKIQQAAKDLVKLSQDVSDVKYNMGFGKAKSSFVPEAKSVAQEAVKEGGKKLQQLLNRINDHRGEMDLKEVGLQLDSIASSLRRETKKNLSDEEGNNLKMVSDDLMKIAKKISKSADTTERIQNSDEHKEEGLEKATKVDIKNNPLNQVLPQLAQYASKLGNMELGNTGDRNVTNGASSADSNVPSGKAIKNLDLGLQKAVDSDRLLQIADQLKGVGNKMMEAQTQQKANDPTQRAGLSKSLKQIERQTASDDKKEEGSMMEKQTASDDKTEEKKMMEVKRQAALQSIDNFLDDMMEQQKKMGKSSVKDVSKNASKEEKMMSAASKGQGGKNRQSLFSKGVSDQADSGRGLSGVPLSEDIDNAYPMEENLASPEIFEKIIKRVKKHREKLANTPLEQLPPSSLSKVSTKTQKQETTNTKQPELTTDPRMELGIPKGEGQGRMIKVNAEPQKPHSSVPIIYNKDFNKQPESVKIPLKSSDLPDKGQDLKNIPLETRSLTTKIEAGQKLSEEQKQAAPISHPNIPQEYQDIIKRIYLVNPEL